MRRFILQFTLFSLGCYALLLSLRAAFGPGVVHPLAGWVLGALLLFTGLAYALAAWATARSPTLFTVAYFIGVVLRLVLSLGAALAYLWSAREASKSEAARFVGALLVAYFLSAGFEIWAIFSNLRPFSAKQLPKSE